MGMAILFLIFAVVFYLLGVAIERERWIYHNHFLENGVAKCYKNGKIVNL